MSDCVLFPASLSKNRAWSVWADRESYLSLAEGAYTLIRPRVQPCGWKRYVRTDYRDSRFNESHSTFPFWREMTIRFYRRRNSAVVLPWLVIGFNLVWMIWEVQSQNWAMEAILQAFSRLIVVLLFAEIIVITQQVNSEH